MKGQIRRYYKKTDRWCQLVITAPDCRFPQEPLKGGIDIKTAEHEAKQRAKMGMLVDIFSSKV